MNESTHTHKTRKSKKQRWYTCVNKNKGEGSSPGKKFIQREKKKKKTDKTHRENTIDGNEINMWEHENVCVYKRKIESLKQWREKSKTDKRIVDGNEEKRPKN